MSIETLKRRLDRLRTAGAGRSIVVELQPDETLAQLRRRVQAMHGDLGDCDLVIIERTDLVGKRFTGRK